jgi:polyketide cyclase/dehydrase/lipid transport protein
MAWQMEHSADSRARPEAVWKRYVDVDNWSEWSEKGVERSHLDGEFKEGTTGKSKAPGFPEGKFRLITVEPEKRFVSEAKFPGGRLTFEHIIEPRDEGSRITHRATVDGPLSFIYIPLVKRPLQKGLPTGVDRLAELAVEKEEEDRQEAEEDKEREARLEETDEQFREEIKKTSRGEGDKGGASVPGA